MRATSSSMEKKAAASARQRRAIRRKITAGRAAIIAERIKLRELILEAHALYSDLEKLL